VRTPQGLTRRTIVASAVLVLLIGSAFAVLLRANAEQHAAGRLATRSQEVLAATNTLERLLLDLETGQRGFVVSGEERFLEPWSAARRELPGASALLVSLSAGVPAQQRRARSLVASIRSYMRDYSVPYVQAVRRHDPSVRSPAVLNEGLVRVNALRRQFDAITSAERALFEARERRSMTDANRATVAAVAGLAASVVLIVVITLDTTRRLVVPVRRASAMADRMAGGDLSTRLPETGTAEIGTLERAFNTMGRALEASRDELRRLADEQAALRRVATLVALGVPAAELLDGVAHEVARPLDADAAWLLRYEPDGTMTVLAGTNGPIAAGAGARRLTLEGRSVARTVQQTGRTARLEAYDGASDALAEALGRQGIRASMGAPIVVDGRLWGVIVAAWERETVLPPDLEFRMAQFTELVATAIANANGRAALAASRARVVATADETRRRIERDLHDGAQQSLTHAVITLKLAKRALDPGEPASRLIDEALGHAERATGELRDLAHGILPAALIRSGLRPAIETLRTRIRVPVFTDVTDERLPSLLEATAYFIVAEALTNVVKHAQATRAYVRVQVDDGALRVEVGDDGVGGAKLDGSSGLLGLKDRAAAVNGELTIESTPGTGTVVVAMLPITPE
jgi:signal transduction histidine kinase